VRERVDVTTRRPAEHRHERCLTALGDLAHARQASVAELSRGDLSDAPQPLDRQGMQELELSVGRHDEEPVGLRDRACHLREELRAGDPDRDWQPHLLADLAAQPDGDLRRAAGDVIQPANIEKCLIDRQTLDQRCRVLEDPEHGLACLAVGRHPGRDHDRPGAQPAGAATAHRRAHAIGLGLVACSQHDTGADDHRPAAQSRVIALLDGRVERIQIRVEDVRVG